MNFSFDQTNTNGPTRMNLFLMRPKSGHVLEIYTRRRNVDFHYGFCCAVVFAGAAVQFLEGFRHRIDSTNGREWSEPSDFGFQLREGFTFEIRPQAEWMPCSGTQGEV
jgi:hypothetical protein